MESFSPFRSASSSSSCGGSLGVEPGGRRGWRAGETAMDRGVGGCQTVQLFVGARRESIIWLAAADLSRSHHFF